MSYIPRLKQEYKERVIKALTEEFGYQNVMQVPKLQKIVVSRGVGAAVSDKKTNRSRCGRVDQYHGSKSCRYTIQEGRCYFQIEKGYANWSKSDA